MRGDGTWGKPQVSRIVATGADVLGTQIPSPLTAPIIQAGSTVITNQNTYGDVTFPTPFPNGVITVVLTNGDAAASSATAWGVTGTSKTGFGLRISNNQTTRVNWVAIGW